MGGREARTQAKGLAEMISGLILQPEGLAREAQVKHEFCVIRSERQRATIVSQCFVQTVLLPANHSQQEEDFAVSRIRFKDLPVLGCGLIELSGLVKLPSLNQCFRDCAHVQYLAVSKIITRPQPTYRYCSGR